MLKAEKLLIKNNDNKYAQTFQRKIGEIKNMRNDKKQKMKDEQNENQIQNVSN